MDGAGDLRPLVSADVAGGLRDGGGGMVETGRPSADLLRVGHAEDDAIQRVRIAQRDGDVAYLLRALGDPIVRSWAARFLGKLGATEAAPALVRLLDATDPKARVASVDALRKLRAAEATRQLIALAEADPDLAVQTHAIAALGDIGDELAPPVLENLLESRNWLVRTGAARALGRCAGEEAVPALRAASKRYPIYRRWVYWKAIWQIQARERAG
jgi:HEAT repeat protein